MGEWEESPRLMRGTVTTVTAEGPFIEVPDKGYGYTFGPCEVLTDDPLVVPGARVLVGSVGGTADDLIILGVVDPAGMPIAPSHNHDATYQAKDADLTAIAGLVSAADKLPYATGAQTWALTTLTAYIRTLLDDVDAAAARATLGLGTAATTSATAYQAVDTVLTALASLSPLADRLPYFTGTSTATLATLTAFARTLLDDVDATAARSTLGLGTAATTSATAYQAADTELTALAGTTAAADRLPYFNSGSTAATAIFTAFARTLLDDVDAAAARVTLGAAATSHTHTQSQISDLLVQRGRVASGTFTAADTPKTVAVVFPAAYAAAPEVVVSAYNVVDPLKSAIAWDSVTTTGFNMIFTRNPGTASIVGTWIAVGT